MPSPRANGLAQTSSQPRQVCAVHAALTLLVASSLAAGCAEDSNQAAQAGVAGAHSVVTAVGTAGASGGAGAYASGVAAVGGAALAGRSAVSTAGSLGLAGSGIPGAAGGGAGSPAAGASAAGSGGAGIITAAGSGATGGAGAEAGAAAAGSTGGATAGAAGGGEATTADDPCGADAQTIMGTTRASGSGNTNLQTSGDVEFLSARSTLIVPAKPSPQQGTLFLWPGLQPLKQDNVIGYGVLQPVLTWGSSCAPGTLSVSDGWWISAQYVGTPAGSFNIVCKGGKVMKVEIGDKLDIEMKLDGTNWVQTVTNQRNGESVDFSIDMKGQKQQWLLHQIEVPTSTKPTDDVIFTDVVAKLSASQPKSCLPNAKGTNDYYAPPRASADGKTCCISKIILRASGIKASSPDTP